MTEATKYPQRGVGHSCCRKKPVRHGIVGVKCDAQLGV